MAMSIVHRITGVGLYVGVLLLAWFLIALSSDATTFAIFSGFIHSIIGQLLLFGFTWALFHHMLGGVRHALWDAGYRPRSPAARATRASDVDRRHRADDHRLDHRLRRPLRRPMPESYRTPLGRVRALGAARLGTEDAWRIRITSLALIPLIARLRHDSC